MSNGIKDSQKPELVKGSARIPRTSQSSEAEQLAAERGQEAMAERSSNDRPAEPVTPASGPAADVSPRVAGPAGDIAMIGVAVRLPGAENLDELWSNLRGGTGKKHQLLVLSARTEDALGQAAESLASHLESCPEASLPDVAFTLQTARTHFDHRRMVVCQSAAEGAAALRKPAAPSSRHLDERQPEFLFLFPGQGAQHVNMGKALYASEPVFKSSVDACAEILADRLRLDLRDIIFPPDGHEESATARLNQTGLAQPALFVIGYASARLWMDLDICPSAMIGHSVGELAAACLAGVFSLEDALVVLAERARLMQSMPPGSMRAVSLSEAALTPHLTGGVSLAGCNALSLSVVSGPNEAIAAFDEAMKKQGTSCIILHTSHAFHSSMMEPIVPAFAEVVSRVARFAPKIPILSTLTGTWLSPDEAIDPSYWARQLRQPVRFSQAFERARAERKYVAIDMGPSGNLAASARRHLPRTEASSIIQAMPRANEPISADHAFALALGQAWLAGGVVNWHHLHAGEARLLLSLPTQAATVLTDQPPAEASDCTATPAAPSGTARMHSSSPLSTEYADYFGRYISLVPEAQFVSVLRDQPEEFRRLLGGLSPEQAGYRYAPGKWTVRQVLGHVVDAERVFAYRALCIARGEKASLPSFDENQYADAAGHDSLALGDLLDEFTMVRRSNVALFQHLDSAAWQRVGMVHQNAISTRGLAYIMVGHAQHHSGVLKERYAAALGR